jgi:hypothetical protein
MLMMLGAGHFAQPVQQYARQHAGSGFLNSIQTDSSILIGLYAAFATRRSRINNVVAMDKNGFMNFPCWCN